MDLQQLECVAEAVYYEARGEGSRGMQAVANVIYNRTKSGRFKSTPCAVIKQPRQFTYKRKGYMNVKLYQRAMDAARLMSKDITGGALYFQSTKVRHRKGFTIRIGNHNFFR